jgi:hypothetical protein
VLKDPSDLGLREDLDLFLREMSARNNKAEAAAREIRARMDKQLGDKADRTLAGVQRRNREAVGKAADAVERDLIQDMVADIRQFDDLARRNRDAPEMVGMLERMYEDLMLVSGKGSQKASDLRKQMLRSGIIHLVRKDTKTDDELDALVDAMSGMKTDEDIAAFIKGLRQPRVLDYINEWAVVNMLSSPTTQVVNISANGLQVLGRLGGIGIEAASDRAFHGGKNITFREVGAAHGGAMRGGRVGLAEARDVMLTGRRSDAYTRAVELGDVRGVGREYLTEKFGKAGAALHFISTRPLEAADALLGRMAYTATIEQYATRKAHQMIQAGEKGSLEQVSQRIVDNIHDHMDIIEKAGKIREYTLLREHGKGRLEGALRMMASTRTAKNGSAAEQIKSGLAHFFLPFFNVPLNYARQGLDRSLGAPINTIRAIGEQAPEAQAELVKKAVVGWTTLAAAGTLAASDNLTGDGPSNPGERAMWLETHRPNSFRWPGTTEWVSYAGSPWGVPFAIIANAKEEYDGAEKGADRKGMTPFETGGVVAMGAMRGAASGILRNSFLQSFANAYEAVTGFGDFPNALAAQAVNRNIPAGAMLGFLARFADPMERDAQTVPERVQNRIPIARQGLDPKQDLLGREVENENSGLRALNPFQPTRAQSEGDPTIATFNAADKNISLPADTMTIQGFEVRLTPDEQRRWQALRGEVLEGMLADLSQDSDWLSAPLEIRQKIVEQATRRSGEIAKKGLMGEMDSASLSDRIDKEAARRYGP